MDQRQETGTLQKRAARVSYEDSGPGFWGYYEYNEEIKEMKYDQDIDVRNHKKVKGFIRNWVEKHLDGLQTKPNTTERSFRNPPGTGS